MRKIGSTADFEVVQSMEVAERPPHVPADVRRGETGEWPMLLPMYLYAAHPDTFPSISAAKKAVRRQELLLNDGEANVSARVNPGDRLKRLARTKPATTAALFVKPHLSLPIVYEDDYIAVVVKPPGMPVHGTKMEEGAPPRDKKARGPVPSLRTAIAHCLKPSAATDAVLRRPQHAHRLDGPTGGLMVCAKTRPALQNLSIAFQERRVHKRYRALVTGHLEGSGTISTPLSGKPSETEYSVLDELRVQSLFSGTITTVDLWPKTGRHHQLRKHLASLNVPILGDKRYHPADQAETLLRGEGLFLWALELKFDHPITGEALNLTIEEPEKFTKWREKEQRRWEKLSSVPKKVKLGAEGEAPCGDDVAGGAEEAYQDNSDSDDAEEFEVSDAE
ncbi:pseudouridine synthase [Tribonema minus]|uniref:Pseudouridine synthase n=1 Tax=Tribonema minus TaxID=303371 RepID=A0A836CLS8_9STRA|nr:pseudouridine synthase [Tribonema minus]